MFQNLKKVNDRIISANCPAHILHYAAKKAADKIEVHAAVLVVKIFSNFNCTFLLRAKKTV
jgi:hypothetical protein